jgi:uncharacterized damage-inducible protein DinB
MKTVTAFLLCLVMAFSVTAQTAPSGQSAQSQPAPPLAEWLSNYYMATRNNLAKSAEKMAEENYGMRPGPQQEVRTFGQILGHLANSNFFYCSIAKGEKNPATMDYEKATTKADLVKGLNDAFAYCDAVYKGQTNASLLETVTTTGANNRQIQFIRLTRLIQNVAHNNEHYGNLVTYFRIKSIVPPSSEKK